MKKITIIIIILLISGAVFLIFKSKNDTPTKTVDISTTQNQADDTEIETINKEVESINIGSTDDDFNGINKDLQGL